MGVQNLARESTAISLVMTKPNQVLLSALLAKQYQISPGDYLTLGHEDRKISVRIAGLLDSQNSFSNTALTGLLITDIATAQEIVDMKDQISHIDLILPTGQSDLKKEIEASLPPNTEIVETQKSNESLRQMSSSFELNLTALSLLALVVGLFLIYNTVTFSVVKRRNLIGIFRALGTTRSEIFIAICSETLVIGFIGTIIGLMLGVGLGTGIVRMVSQSVTDFYFVLTVNQFNVSWISLFKGFLLGMAASLLSAIAPALEATRVPPITALRRSDIERRTKNFVPLLSTGGVLLLVMGAFLLYLPLRTVVISFAGLCLIVFGFAFLVPILTIFITKLLNSLFTGLFGVSGKLAIRNIPRTLSRTGIAIASLMVAVSVIVGIGIMVESFRFTVIQWLGNTIRADIYIRSPNQFSTALPPELIAELQSRKEVSATFVIQGHAVKSGQYTNSRILALAQDFPQREWVWSIGDEESIKHRFDQGWVFVSEPFAWKHQIIQKPGVSIQLLTDEGLRNFKVAGIFSDFSAPQGIIIIKSEFYNKYWHNRSITGMALYLKPGVNTQQLITSLEDQFSKTYSVMFVSNRSLRQAAIDVFERTFTVTIALQVLAAVVAFISILNTVMALILERMREIGILRANGTSRHQLIAMILIESGVTGLIAGLLSLPLGTLMAWVLVFIINKRSFGWTLEFVLSGEHFYKALIIAVAASLLAGIYPAISAANLKITQALRTE